MREDWLDQLKKVLREIEDSEDCELELVEENLSITIDELETLI